MRSLNELYTFIICIVHYDLASRAFENECPLGKDQPSPDAIKRARNALKEILPTIKDMGDNKVVAIRVREIFESAQKVVNLIMQMKNITTDTAAELRLFNMIPVIGTYAFRNISRRLPFILDRSANAGQTKVNLLTVVRDDARQLKEKLAKLVSEKQASEKRVSDKPRSESRRNDVELRAQKQRLQEEARRGLNEPKKSNEESREESWEKAWEEDRFVHTIAMVETCALVIDALHKNMIGNPTQRARHLYFHPSDEDAFPRLDQWTIFDSPFKLCLTTISLFLKRTGKNVDVRAFVDGLIGILTIHDETSYIKDSLRYMADPHEMFANTDDFRGWVGEVTRDRKSWSVSYDDESKNGRFWLYHPDFALPNSSQEQGTIFSKSTNFTLPMGGAGDASDGADSPPTTPYATSSPPSSNSVKSSLTTLSSSTKEKSPPSTKGKVESGNSDNNTQEMEEVPVGNKPAAQDPGHAEMAVTPDQSDRRVELDLQKQVESLQNQVKSLQSDIRRKDAIIGEKDIAIKEIMKHTFKLLEEGDK